MFSCSVESSSRECYVASLHQSRHAFPLGEEKNINYREKEKVLSCNSKILVMVALNPGMQQLEETLRCALPFVNS